MGSPQPVPAPSSGLPPGVEPGDIGKRVVAYLIEWAAPAVIVWALSLIGVLAQNVMVSLIISLVSFVAVIGWVIFVWWSYVTKAAGPGKQLMGLQVVGFSDGRPLSWGRVILRWLITGVIAGTGIGAIVLIILTVQNPRRQSLADTIVDSVVIKERALAPKQLPGQQQSPAQQPSPANYQPGPAGPGDRGLFPPQERGMQTPVRYGQTDRYGREQQPGVAAGTGQSQPSPYPRQDQFGGPDQSNQYGQDQYAGDRYDAAPSQPVQDRYGQDQYGQRQQDQYAQGQYRQDQPQDAYGSAQQVPDQYGQGAQYGQGDQYGQRGQDQYGQDQYAQSQGQYGQDQGQYGQDQYQQDQYQQDPYQHDQYQQDAYSQDPYGQDRYGQDQYGQDRFGGRPGSGVTPVAAPIPGATQFPAAPPPPVSGGSATEHREPDPRPLSQGWQATLDDGRQIEVTRIVLLGRNPQARPGEEDAQLIKISDETRTVSKTHLALGVDAGGMYVMDRGSTNGSTATDLDGHTRPCAPGDVVQVDIGTIVSFGDHWLEVKRP
jgi:uncharacterized RDD family membrane protein YckC